MLVTVLSISRTYTRHVDIMIIPYITFVTLQFIFPEWVMVYLIL